MTQRHRCMEVVAPVPSQRGPWPVASGQCDATTAKGTRCKVGGPMMCPECGYRACGNHALFEDGAQRCPNCQETDAETNQT